MTNLTVGEPSGLMSLRDAINRVFEESFLRPDLFGGQQITGASAPLDVYETEDGIVLKAAVPGVKPEDIEVTITGDVLTIKGEYKEESDSKRKNYLRQERRYGAFCRQLSLPAGLDMSKVSADFEHGVLTLQLPKAEEVKPKSVKVSVKR